MTIIEIEAKRKMLEDARQAAVDRANLQLAPLQAQINQLEKAANASAMKATEVIAALDGKIAMLDEVRASLYPAAPIDTAAPGRLATEPEA